MKYPEHSYQKTMTKSAVMTVLAVRIIYQKMKKKNESNDDVYVGSGGIQGWLHLGFCCKSR